MVFSSLIFLFMFLVFTIAGYFILPVRARNAFLFFVSLFFYAWGEPSLVALMIVSIILNYAGGLLVDKFKKKEMIKRAKIALGIFCALDIGILFFFKYTGFLFDNISVAFNTALPFHSFFSDIVMPIGISFYTFQMMSYVIDVYRDDAEAQKNIIDFGCYVVLFPQLIAGPIVQYKTIAEQLKKRETSFEKFASGILLFMAGLSKKVLLANNIGALSTTIHEMDLNTLPALTAFIGACAYFFQIYFDFSGYSDMALGLGRMFGFEFLENFNYPYISKSVTEFWRRWHISLSTWFRDYVYIPLGGNRRGFSKQIRNLAVVWLLTGFWHGAQWNFVLWGVWFGLLIILEKLFLLKWLEKVPAWIGHIWTLFCAWFSWVLFYDYGDALENFRYIGALLGKSGKIADSQTLWFFTNYAVLFLICAVAATPIGKKAWSKIGEKKCGPFLRVAALIISFALTCAYITASTYNPFIYFRF